MKDPVRRTRAQFLCGSMLAVACCAALPASAQSAPQSGAVTASPGVAQPGLPAPADGAGATQAGGGVDARGEPTGTGPATDIVVTGSRIARNGFEASTPVNVIGADDIKLSGNVNVEKTLAQIPQAVGSALGSATSNTVPGGYADVNLRGFGSQRNLVLVNGRRFAIFGPEQVTDLNTIPSTLVERTEVVTGGSSAVYGSDAITGVVNFIIRNDFQGVEARGQVNIDGPTGTPVYNADLTMGGNFADGRGNVVVSGNYLNRGAITRGKRGGYAYDTLVDGCVVPGTGSSTRAGTPFAATSAVSGCVAAGGQLGFVAGGSGDIPNGRFSGLPTFAAASPSLQAAYAAAGLSGLGARGFTFDNAGTVARPALTPQDDFNLGPFNYLIQPQERWMINSFSHYDLSDAVTGYMELHYSNNTVDAQLAPTNVGASTLFNVNNPYLSPALQNVLRQRDAAETGTTTVTSGSTSRTTVANDGLAVITAGRRYVENGARFASERRNVFRGAWGLRGDLGQVSDAFLTDLKYDIYYSYARSEDTLQLSNAISRSRLQAALLSNGTAAPVCNIFGANVSTACVQAISIGALNSTIASQQVAQGSVTGTVFTLPAGPVGFSYGYEWRKAKAAYTPDTFLASGDVVGFNPGLPTRGSTSVKEVFGEIRVPLIHDTPFIDSLVANGGFRYSKYNLSGIGGVWTYLGGLDWRVNRTVTLRGQYQRAIRAPSVAELFGGSSRQIITAVDPCSNRIAAAQQTAVVRQLCIATGVPAAAVFGAAVQPNAFFSADTGGNDRLRAEVSNTYTAGIVVTPEGLPGLYASVDYFNIALKGAVSQLGGGLQGTLNLCYLTVQSASSEFCQAVQRNPLTGEINEPYAVQIRNANSGVLKTSGIDFAVRYRLPLGFGFPGFGPSSKIDLSTNYTWLAQFNNTPVAALPAVIYKCAGSFGPTCGQPLPRWRGVTRVTWQTGDLGVSARHRYIGPVVTDRFVVPLRQGSATTPQLSTIVYPKLAAANYFDLSFTYDVARGMQLFGGANNVLGSDPRITTQGPNANTFSATYDVLGTEFFLGATLKF